MLGSQQRQHHIADPALRHSGQQPICRHRQPVHLQYAHPADGIHAGQGLDLDRPTRTHVDHAPGDHPVCWGDGHQGQPSSREAQHGAEGARHGQRPVDTATSRLQGPWAQIDRCGCGPVDESGEHPSHLVSWQVPSTQRRDGRGGKQWPRRRCPAPRLHDDGQLQEPEPLPSVRLGEVDAHPALHSHGRPYRLELFDLGIEHHPGDIGPAMGAEEPLDGPSELFMLIGQGDRHCSLLLTCTGGGFGSRHLDGYGLRGTAIDGHLERL